MDLIRKAMWSAGGRKFLTMVLTMIALPWLHKHNIPVEVIFSMAGVALAFIFGEGAKDAVAALRQQVQENEQLSNTRSQAPAKPEESSSQAQAVRRIGFMSAYKSLILVGLLPLVLGGCWGTRPPEVSKAAMEREKLIKTYVANDDAEDTFLIEQYREAEYARIVAIHNAKIKEIDGAVENDLAKLAGADGKIALTPDQAASVLKQVREKKKAASDSAEAYKRKVDDVIQKLYAARAKNKLNLAIATKLHAAIEAYENAGIDMSAAQEGVDQIFLLLQKYKVVADNPAAAELNARKNAIMPTANK